MIPVFLLLLLGGVYALRYYRFFANRLQGTVVQSRPLPLLAKMRLHVFPSLAGIVLSSILVIFEHAPVWAVAIPILGYVGLISLPLSYQLTSEGIRLGFGTFRRWTEFAGARRFRGGAKLQGANGRRGMRIWLSGTRGDDEFLHVLRRTIRDAYKGDIDRSVRTAKPEDPGTSVWQQAV